MVHAIRVPTRISLAAMATESSEPRSSSTISSEASGLRRHDLRPRSCCFGLIVCSHHDMGARTCQGASGHHEKTEPTVGPGDDGDTTVESRMLSSVKDMGAAFRGRTSPFTWNDHSL